MRKTVRRLGRAGMLYLVVGVPSLIVGTAFNSHAGVAFLLGVVLFGSIVVQNGARWCVGVTMLGSGAVFLAGIWARDPILLALVVGGTAFLAGASTRWARQTALIAVPITAAVLSSPVATSTVVGRSLGLLAGGLYGAVALTVTKFPAPPRGDRLPAGTAMLYGVLVGTVVAVGTAAVTALDLPHGYWLTLTFLAVMQPSIVGSKRKTLQRAGGTIVGAAAALVVASVVPATGAEIAVGLAFVIASVMLTSDYRVYAALMTVGVVLLVEGKTPPVTAVELRVGLTVVAALIVLGLCYLVPYLVHRFDPEVTPTHGHD